MKVKTILKGVVRTFAWILTALVFFLCGTAVMLYSPWVQEQLRQALVKKLSTPELTLQLDSFRLRFPLDISAGGLMLISEGDTMAAAESLKADIGLLPLLAGNVRVDCLEAVDAGYVMGSPDSAMYMRIHADSIGLAPVSVHLSDMAIAISDGTIRGGRLGMTMNQDSAAPTPPAPPQKMSFAIDRLRLDDFAYTMRMMPTIDTLDARFAHSEMRGGLVDLYSQNITLKCLDGDGLTARYMAPDSAALAALPAIPEPAALPDSLVAPPWTIAIDTIAFSHSEALYTTAGYRPMPGLDFGYISVDSLDLRLFDFYNRQTTVRLPIEVSGRERCGVSLQAKGEIDIDSVAMSFRKFELSTPEGTSVAFDGKLGSGDLAADPNLPLLLSLDGKLAPSDLSRMFPAFMPYFAAIPKADDVQLSACADGTAGHLDISALSLNLNRCVSLNAKGFVENFMNPDCLGGNLSLSGRIINVSSFKNVILDPATAKTLNIPPMSLNGRVIMNQGTIKGNLLAITKGGRIGLDARWNSRRESYNATVKASTFPVQAFMPLLDVRDVTADVTVDGHGYSPFSRRTAIDARAVVHRAVYKGTEFTDIVAEAKLKDGMADVRIDSGNDAADFALNAEGNLDGDTYKWHAMVDGRYIDLYALGFSETPSSLELTMTADATVGPGRQDLSGDLHLGDLFFRQESGTVSVTDLTAHLAANDSTTSAAVHNGDMTVNFISPECPDSLFSHFAGLGSLIADELKDFSFRADTLGKAMPRFDLDVMGGRSNFVNNILKAKGMSVRSFTLHAGNDSIFALDANALRFETGSMVIDSLFVNGHEHDRHFHFNAGVKNRPGNLDEWHEVTVRAALQDSSMSMRVHQENISGKTGFDIGMVADASAADSMLTLHIRPYAPVIGYQNWTVNDDNFISYTIPTKHLDANLHMTGGNSSLEIFTEETEGHDSHAAGQEDVVIRLGNVHLQDWIAVNPFAPPVKGDMNADIRLNRHDGRIIGNGTAGVSGLLYGKEKVADVKADFNIAASHDGTINARADLFVDGMKTMTLSGALNDSTAVSPLDLDFSVIHFPLATVNPFLPSTVGRISGMLNGTFRVSGTQDRPIMNGTIDFDSTAVRLAMTGTSYAFSSNPVNVVDNMVDFKDFSIRGCNDNPLRINGTVDIGDMADMKMNLSFDANNMMIVDSKRAAKGADIFGKGYISLKGSAHGSMSFLQMNANLSVNPGTNITYVMSDATNSLTNRSAEDMVKFVNFSDTAAVARADSIADVGLALALDAVLTVQEGSVVNVYLSPDGANRIQLQTDGTLTYSLTPLDAAGRLVGRLNINKGFIRYTPPVLSELYFNFQDNSYVSFNGDMMNPNLNIHAVDVKKANVTGEGQNSRLVNFDVLLGVTGTLSQMDVKFDLATNDDMTVANELETMSAEQRANQAMNMLLYNVYTGPGTKANSALAGNPLYSFLESKINTWAANNIRGVDLSFGIDQYDRTVNGSTSQTTSYSYQVSKALFNDRFKIAVGGNYSTDANADENFSQNLINDISFEYYINDAHTMYVRLFRHTGFESILEGEITQTGVGFVYRRKLRRLGDMFLPVKYVRRRIEKENNRLQGLNDKEK